ncbi:GNAT family N-acetyltransferase [Blastococcus goldschmidtiae]|uniref:GNAT family N-acetyltransferase n=1 Tax=Blastococcus goldschmidtiae TaxID=3075546 RepID=A0ABU2K802_9ACTN|nr:GNAT family N-acetyltransferase [Blastococcus sp. DSM 46792]MDT0276317.1 GNAT family N-acetyltransferase [Blastococcus sp. DSM 46792]
MILPPWPAVAPAHGDVVLRRFTEDDAALVRELSSDPYVPLISTVPAAATREQALDWIDRNQRRREDGVGFSFAVAVASTGRAVGQVGLWLAELPSGRASVGYLVAPGSRGRGFAGSALAAVTAFAWTVPGLHRVQLFVEPSNEASVRTARGAGYEPEGLLRSYREIGGRRRDMLIFGAVREG